MQYKTKKICTQSASFSKGMSLIEVLVALLLVTITGFGVLSMINFSTQESHYLRFEMTADHLGRALLSRVQANGSALNKDIYATDNTQSSPQAQDCTSGCNPEAIARLDLAEWSAEVSQLLPNAQYRTWWEGNVIRLAIAWQDPSNASPETDCPLSLDEGSACKVYTASVAL